METFEFQAEVRQLLQLMIHSIYSTKNIFLRELISNASDALDKLRMAAYHDKDLDADLSDPHIALSTDRTARTLTVSDNGIGMSRDEVVNLIGTIAKSGTAELLRSLKEQADASTLIGKFGVGFYSTFMVADRVTLVTRRAGEQTGTRWESDGQGSYTLEEIAGPPQGTSVTVHLKAEDSEDNLHDYTSEWKIREIVKRYSDFISWPIRLPVSRDGAEGDSSEVTETLNSMKALWSRPKDDISEAEYHDFYRHLTHDWESPLETIHMRTEGSFAYDALLFIPSRPPADLYLRETRVGVQLYVRRVFITEDGESLMPGFLRFMKGVIDAADLSLNVSREILQQDRHIQAMRRRLAKKVLSTIGELREQSPERYQRTWEQFGRAIKEGLITDPEHRDSILSAAVFESTHDSDKPTTLADYVQRMKEGQDSIYYLTGPSRALLESSPHIEQFLDQGYEVLLLTDPVDEVWAEQVREYDGKPLQSIAKGEISLGTQKESAHTEDFSALLSWLGTQLEADISQARLSERLTASPACVVSDSDGLTPALQRLLESSGQQFAPLKRILEINPNHALVTALRERHASGDDVSDFAHLLYDLALIAEGGQPRDPAAFSRLLAGKLTHLL